VDTQQGVIRYDVDLPQAAEQVYASALPDLPTCSVVPAGTACSPTAIDRPPLPNDIRFDKKGYAYLSDSFQATIWRIPPGGGQPEIWYQDPQLDADFGPNGIGIKDDTNELYFASTFGAFGQGFIYKLPLVDKPTTNDLKLFYQYNPGDGPDGIAFGESGNLYVALAGANQISVLNPDGTESTRYSGPAIDPNNPNQSIPWTNPANIAFNDKTRSLLVTNHASLVPNPEPLFSVYTVYVDDEAVKTPEPSVLGAIFITSLLGWGYRRKLQHKL
ncbi:MAG TPA: SMP-30/gluconolactonase/LRE family protein, partial [Nostocaceae cyanobacterium]|nr:SMP-30/gluconolactonase/LRE family protein [Nostocaceae cyanobacterium]